jgi:hypothetical protein
MGRTRKRVVFLSVIGEEDRQIEGDGTPIEPLHDDVIESN